VEKTRVSFPRWRVESGRGLRRRNNAIMLYARLSARNRLAVRSFGGLASRLRAETSADGRAAYMPENKINFTNGKTFVQTFL
jgi:hypothetical protein